MKSKLLLSLSCVLVLALGASAQPGASPAAVVSDADRKAQAEKKHVDDSTDQLVEIYLEAGTKAVSEGFKEDGTTLLLKALEIADRGKLERLSVARVLENLGKLAEDDSNFKKADLNKAEGYYVRSVTLTENVLGKDSATVLKNREDLAEFYARAKKYDRMERVLVDSLKRIKESQGSGSPAKQPRTILPVLQQLAVCYRYQKRYDDAEKAYLNLLYQVKEIDGVDSPLMALAFNNLADLYREQERHTEAEKCLESAVGVMDKAFGPSDPMRPVILRALAGVKQKLGKTTEAEQLHVQVMNIANASGKNDFKAMGLLEVASFYHNDNKDAKAEKYYTDALAILTKDGESRNLANALIATAECRLVLGKTDLAAPDLDRAQAMVQRLDGSERESMAQVLRAQGKCLLAQGKTAEAEKALKEAKAISTKLAGADDLTVGYSWELLGNVYMAEDNLTEANACFEKATEIEEKFSKVAPLRLAESLTSYSRLLEKMQRPNDASKQAKRAADLRATLGQQ